VAEVMGILLDEFTQFSQSLRMVFIMQFLLCTKELANQLVYLDYLLSLEVDGQAERQVSDPVCRYHWDIRVS
jgi:hypothetical protein